MKELQELPVWLWIVLAAAVMLQGTWLFLHARDRGQGWKAWFWGIWGLTVVPTPALCYLLFVVLPDNRKRKADNNR